MGRAHKVEMAHTDQGGPWPAHGCLPLVSLHKEDLGQLNPKSVQVKSRNKTAYPTWRTIQVEVSGSNRNSDPKPTWDRYVNPKSVMFIRLTSGALQGTQARRNPSSRELALY
jgi:hypothetical protein